MPPKQPKSEKSSTPENRMDGIMGSNSQQSVTANSLGLPMSNASSTTSGSTDFVKKLFLMLEDNSYERVVKWTKNGDSFVVVDTNEFTKEILPKHFKHSNFASFVRQLNKYDFHKVKQSNEEKQLNEHGEGSWEFRHPDFRRHDREALDTIKRKGPVQKRNSAEETQSGEVINRLEETVNSLRIEQRSLRAELKATNEKYINVVESILAMKNTNDRYFQSINTLVNALVSHGIKLPQLDLPSLDTQAFSSQLQGQSLNSSNPQVTLGSTNNNGSSSGNRSAHHQRTTSSNSPVVALRPGFHVLLVEDDNVCIQLCQKFLQKYGCTVEVVSDGLLAISALEKSRYDIVFMDIIMPNLDGATATSIVRSFDNQTPIIAMTGNVNDQDLVSYLQHGLSDILAKPFTKDDLYLMLDKHLSNRTPLAYQTRPVPTQIPPQSAESFQTTGDLGEEQLSKRQKL